MVKARIAVSRMQQNNPLVESPTVREYVYAKPKPITNATVYDIFAIFTSLDVTQSRYELCILTNYGGYGAMQKHIGNGGNGQILFQNTKFDIKYIRDNVIDGKTYALWHLVGILDQNPTQLDANGILMRYHILVF
jgi:hypothetical protein